jgi:cathepsin L
MKIKINLPLLIIAFALCSYKCKYSKDETSASASPTLDSLNALRNNSESASKFLELNKLKEIIESQQLSFSVGLSSVSGQSISQITGEPQLTKFQNDSLKKILIPELKELEGTPKYLKIKGVILNPDSPKLDLREYGLVTPIKNQGFSESCWAFGSMSAYESSFLIVNQILVDASEQYVINCSGAGTAQYGGFAFQVLRWMTNDKKNVDEERLTPFQAIDGQCKSPINTSYYAIDWGLVDPSNDPGAIPAVKQIKEAICRYGVISVSVFVSSLFQNYSEGVFNEKRNDEGTNHAISLIGWDDSKNAWILKNSWGTDWGESCGQNSEKGYMWIDYSSNNVGRRAAWVKARKIK